MRHYFRSYYFGFVGIGLLLLVNYWPDFPIHFFEREIDLGTTSQASFLFEFDGAYDSVLHKMKVVSAEDGAPLLCYADIHTPVCIEGVCKPLDLRLYWDLAGAYLGYATIDELPLTKFDHEPFENADYEKLHKLLGNRYASIARRSLDELMTGASPTGKQIVIDGKEVDAVSGATVKEIKDEVVEGALYSCYTLWNLIYGKAETMVVEALHARDSVSWSAALFNAPYNHYHYCALRYLDGGQFEEYATQLFSLFEDGSPSSRKYLLAKLPDALWSNAVFILPYFEIFNKMDKNTQTILLNNLDVAPASCVSIVAEVVDQFTKNQTRIFLHQLENINLPKHLEVRNKLKSIVVDGDFPYNYLIQEYLEKSK